MRRKLHAAVAVRCAYRRVSTTSRSSASIFRFIVASLSLAGAGYLGPGAWWNPPLVAAAAGPKQLSGYHDDNALLETLRGFSAASPRARLSRIAVSAGGRDLSLLTIVPETPIRDTRPDTPPHPAILVVGDPLGVTPVATEAALRLAARLLESGPQRPGADRAAEFTWYIVPRADPDGAARFFAKPRLSDGGNARQVDDDRDGLTDEDGPDDLDGDGLITLMLRPHPAGSWILTADDPPLAKPADPARGERGIYQRLSEGRDDDDDGLFNEDGPGGVVPGRNFPHAFEHWRPAHGVHPASEPESRAILRFAHDHQEIALVLVLGPSNSLARPPKPPAPPAPGAENGTARKFRVTERLASQYGFDPLSEYILEDLVFSLRTLTGNRELTADEVVAMLRPGPTLLPDPADLAWWSALAQAYADSTRAQGLAGPRTEPLLPVPGCLEDWAYFQLGVPALAIDFWSVPRTIDAAAESSLVASAAGAASDSMLARAAPDTSATAGRTPVCSPDPDDQALARFGHEQTGERVYAPWREVALAGVGSVMVGGPVASALRNPPGALLDSLLSGQIPFLLGLPEWLPRLEISALDIAPRGVGVYEVTAHVAGVGRIPYPTAQGARTRRAPPVVVTITGAEVIEGRVRRTLAVLPPTGAAEVRWLVRGRRGTEVVVEASAPPVGSARRAATLPLDGEAR